MHLNLLPLIAFLSVSAAAQNYLSPQEAERRLVAHQANLSELHLTLLAQEKPTGGHEARWKKLMHEGQALEGILACADAEWYYTKFEPQLYRVNEVLREPELFFGELTKLVALTSYRFEELAEQYQRADCANKGVTEAVRSGRAAHERLRPPLKGASDRR